MRTPTQTDDDDDVVTHADREEEGGPETLSHTTVEKLIAAALGGRPVLEVLEKK